MSDNKPKIAIPAWQRASPPPPAQDDPVSSQPEAKEEAETTAPPSPAEEPSEVVVHDSSAVDKPAKQPGPQSSSLQPGEFDEFRQSQQQKVLPPPPPPSPPTQQQQRPMAPPIITYPEFLVEAHKPPPLVTLSNVVNSLYVAGGVAAALYGASKFLVTPMLDGLTASRHNFATHGQGKLDEFNERLSKIVSRVPESKKGSQSGSDSGADDADSETSDPTELYHRDMGTQTSPPPSRPASPSDTAAERDVDAFQMQGLATLRGHLEQLIKGSEKVGESQRERQESIGNLKHYLDQLQYSNSGINVWTGNDDVAVSALDDAVEELKREIRGVKGVLLSAKRFPALSRAVPGT